MSCYTRRHKQTHSHTLALVLPAPLSYRKLCFVHFILLPFFTHSQSAPAFCRFTPTLLLFLSLSFAYILFSLHLNTNWMSMAELHSANGWMPTPQVYMEPFLCCCLLACWLVRFRCKLHFPYIHFCPQFYRRKRRKIVFSLCFLPRQCHWFWRRATLKHRHRCRSTGRPTRRRMPRYYAAAIALSASPMTFLYVAEDRLD